MSKGVLLKEMKENIEAVVSGKIESYKCNCLPLSDFVDYIAEKYSKDWDDFDTNGWQVDFWITYSILGIKYMLEGSMYYGNIEFKRKEE